MVVGNFAPQSSSSAAGGIPDDASEITGSTRSHHGSYASNRWWSIRSLAAPLCGRCPRRQIARSAFALANTARHADRNCYWRSYLPHRRVAGTHLSVAVRPFMKFVLQKRRPATRPLLLLVCLRDQAARAVAVAGR